MRRFLVIFIASLFVPALPHALASALNGKQVMEKQKSLHQVSSETGLEKMVLVDKSGSKENRDIKRYTKEFEKGAYRGLVVFLGPPEVKGTALLTWQHKNKGDDQWLYLPAQGQMQRIAEGGKKNYFMGTDFTYEDLQSEDLDSNTYNLAKTEKCESGNCYVVEAVPANADKAKDSSYNKRVLWVKDDTFVTVKTEFYDKRDKLLKTLTCYDFENVKGSVWRPKKSVMENHKNGHKTLMLSSERKADSAIDNSTFTERFILSGQHVR